MGATTKTVPLIKQTPSKHVSSTNNCFADHGLLKIYGMLIHICDTKK